MRIIITEIFYYYVNFKNMLGNTHVTELDGTLVDLSFPVFSKNMLYHMRSGNYEKGEKYLIEKYIQPNQDVIDLGAGTGYTTCVIDQNTESDTSIIAVEANPRLIPVISKTKSLNNAEFEMTNSAYSGSDDGLEIGLTQDFISSSLYRRSDMPQAQAEVQGASLGKLVEKFKIKAPVQLVVDIEGAEHDLITIESQFIGSEVSRLIFEYHEFTPLSFEDYDERLKALGFEFKESKSSVYVYDRT